MPTIYRTSIRKSCLLEEKEELRKLKKIESNRKWRESHPDYNKSYKQKLKTEKTENKMNIQDKNNRPTLNYKNASYGDWCYCSASKEYIQVGEIVRRGGWVYIQPINANKVFELPMYKDNELQKVILTEGVLANNGFVNIRDNFWVLRDLIVESFCTDVRIFRVMLCNKYIILDGVDDLQRIMKIFDMVEEAVNLVL